MITPLRQFSVLVLIVTVANAQTETPSANTPSPVKVKEIEEKEKPVPVPSSINAFSIETGIYSAASTSASTSGIGLLGLEYLRVLNMKWGASFAYNQLLSQSFNLSSSVYGFDLLGHYCIKTCRAFNLSTDPTGARYFPKWSYVFQFGISQKMIQLEDTSIGYNGIRLGGEASYMTQSPLNWFGRAYVSRMINGTTSLNFMALTVGARWWF